MPTAVSRCLPPRLASPDLPLVAQPLSTLSSALPSSPSPLPLPLPGMFLDSLAGDAAWLGRYARNMWGATAGC